jgi:multidrug transporter EmrE-like cation transporter
MPDRAISSMPWRVPLAVWAGAAIVGALAAGTVLLWSHYGSAVFFEMIMTGLAFCF